MQKSLEQEFSERVFVHKSAVILGNLLKFYKDLEDINTNNYLEDINTNNFINLNFEEKAEMHYFVLLQNDKLFNEIYNKCWERIKYVLP